MTAAPTIPEALRKVFGRQFAGIHTCMPGRIESYDDARFSASVAPTIGRGFKGEGGAREVEYLPVIQNVPVMQFGSIGAGRCVKVPVVAGDHVLLVFAEVSLDRWKARGGRIDPGDDRRFHLTDAIAIAGLFDFGSGGGNAPNMIEFTAQGTIHIGGPGVYNETPGPTSSAFVLASAVDGFTGQPQAIINVMHITTGVYGK